MATKKQSTAKAADAATFMPNVRGTLTFDGCETCLIAVDPASVLSLDEAGPVTHQVTARKAANGLWVVTFSDAAPAVSAAPVATAPAVVKAAKKTKK